MKTNTITISLYGHEQTVSAVCGHYKDSIDIKQVATYQVADGLATITSLTPVYGTVIDLPLPFSFGVTDLGSGQLERIDFNVDTMSAHVAICKSNAWATRRALQPAPTIPQQLIADYCSLF